MIKLKNVYAPFGSDDGQRILVERLWPLDIDVYYHRIHRWLKEVSPSYELIEKFKESDHDWEGFQKAYTHELENPQKKDVLVSLKKESRDRCVTLLYAAASENRNFAAVMVEYLDRMS